jgi:hypothetical protein
MTFDRTPKPPECEHPLNQLHAPVQEVGRGVIPRTVLTCQGCKQTWTGGHAYAVQLASVQSKMREIERIARNP